MRAVSLMYHDILDPDALEGSGFSGFSGNRYAINRAEFQAHMAALSRRMNQSPSLATDVLQSRPGNPSVMLTFDDGGLSAYTTVMDILEQYGWKAHFFIPTDWIGQPHFLTAEHIRTLRNRGHVIGSHSCSHPSMMSSLEEGTILKEWVDSVNRLSDIVGEQVTTASVPGGYYSQQVAQVASCAGIRAIFTSEPTGRSHMVGHARVFGRYVVRQGMTPERLAGFIQGDYLSRAREHVSWTIKKLVKAIGGEVYLALRSRTLQRFRGRPSLPGNRHSNHVLSSPMRVLMVIAPTPGTDLPTVWARRQIDSLKAFGVVVDTYVFHNRRSVLGLIRGGLELRRKAREFDADLVHIHFGAAQAVAGVMCAGKPVILSFCGSDLLGNYDQQGRRTWSGLLSGLLSRLGAFGCRRAIAKSKELRQALWLPLLREKCAIIPNGVDLDVFQPIPRARARALLGWNHDDPVVLFMDRKGAWVKDPELAHAAYKEAQQTVPSLRMYVLEHELPEHMPLFFCAADVLLLTSRHEGSNNTVKEALACDLPVVATACGDTPERLQGVHLSYVCSRNARELGERLATVVTVGERSNGRQTVRELAIDRIALRIKTLYEEALVGRQGRGTLRIHCE